MKKHGFTLAEVLVTLGIIGVVAALTTPALIQNVGNAKVGPKLQKAVATFETASEMMLTDQNSNTLLGVSTTSAGLGKALGQYMKINRGDESAASAINYKSYTNSNMTVYSSQNPSSLGNRFDSEEGMIYYILNNGSKTQVHSDYADIPNNQEIGRVSVDINGPDGPNTVAKDLFVFALYNDGTLRPWGSPGYKRHVKASEIGDIWSGSSYPCNKTTVKGNGESCTGSIFDNGMKIIYQ